MRLIAAATTAALVTVPMPVLGYDTAVQGLMAPYDWDVEQRLDLDDYPSFIQPSLREMVAGYNSFRPGMGRDDFEPGLAELMAGLERGFMALSDRPEVPLLARDYVSSAPIHTDWEGMPEGPMDEAVSAVTLLREDPGTPLEPFLLLLAAHRARAAWECYASLYYPEASEPLYASGMQTTADIYSLVLSEALAHPDPAVQWLAGELDDLPWVYIDVSEEVPPGTRAAP